MNKMTLTRPKRVSLDELMRGHGNLMSVLKTWAPGTFYCSKGEEVLIVAGEERRERSFGMSSPPDISAKRAARLENARLYEVVSSKYGRGFSFKVRELPLNYFN